MLRPLPPTASVTGLPPSAFGSQRVDKNILQVACRVRTDYN